MRHDILKAEDPHFLIYIFIATATEVTVMDCILSDMSSGLAKSCTVFAFEGDGWRTEKDTHQLNVEIDGG